MLFMIVPSIADVALASVIGLGMLVVAFDLTKNRKQKAA